jgi:amino acid adenylation domain-containing protein
MNSDFLSLFYQSVKQYPNKTALHFFSESLTYKQLHDLSSQVAIRIIDQNLQPNSPIILEVEKSLISIVYILGILKAGCYYIPIATNIPINRLDYLIKNSESQMAFLNQHYEKFNTREDLQCFLIEKDLFKLSDTKDKSHTELNALQMKPTDSVCCLYTSGSTGYPKGVLMSHLGFAAFFEAVKPIMNMSHDSVCLNTAPFIFDVSIIDTFFPLTIGATVHISPERILPQFILKLITQYRISHMCGVSSTLNLLFGNTELLTHYDISSLTTVMTGAELLHKKTLQNILKYSPTATIINGYGLTETTCLCTAFSINIDNVNDYLLYPIGKTLPGVEAKILCFNNSEKSRGELLLSGDQIMLQYLNNPDANDKVFTDQDGKRFLKTGDIVSYDKDQNFIFHGRNDTQVKINGYRIDLNEIKYALLSNQYINEAEVFMEESDIFAVLSLNLKSKTVGEENVIYQLKEASNNLLPKYMQPKECMILDDLPKLLTGKTDLKELRNIFATRHEKN